MSTLLFRLVSWVRTLTGRILHIMRRYILAQRISKAVLTATCPIPSGPVREIYAFEIPSLTECSFQRLGRVFCPNWFVGIDDTDDTIETKVRAMQYYESEFRLLPHPQSSEALRAIARRWSSVVGLQAGEAFELVGLVRQ